MRIALLAIIAMGLAGCVFRNIPGPTVFDYIVCPDPPPLHPDVIVGSTPCMWKPGSPPALQKRGK